MHEHGSSWFGVEQMIGYDRQRRRSIHWEKAHRTSTNRQLDLVRGSTSCRAPFAMIFAAALTLAVHMLPRCVQAACVAFVAARIRFVVYRSGGENPSCASPDARSAIEPVDVIGLGRFVSGFVDISKVLNHVSILNQLDSFVNTEFAWPFSHTLPRKLMHP